MAPKQPYDPWEANGQEFYVQCVAVALAGVSSYPDGLFTIVAAKAQLAKLAGHLVFGFPDPAIPIYQQGIAAAEANQEAAQAFIDGKTDQYYPAIGANNELEHLKTLGLVDVHIIPTKDELAAALTTATAPQ